MDSDNYFHSWLIGPEDAGEVLDRLNALLRGQLCELLSGGQLPQADSLRVSTKGEISAVFAPSRSRTYLYPSFNVLVAVWDTRGQKMLQARCQCFEGSICRHAESALITAVGLERKDIRPLLADPLRIKEYILSDKASALLEMLQKDGGQQTEKTPTGEPSSHSVAYVVEHAVRGIASAIYVEDRSSHGSNAAGGPRRSWAELLRSITSSSPRLQLQPGVERYAALPHERFPAGQPAYGLTADEPRPLPLDPEDLRIAREVFLTAGLPHASRLPLGASKLTPALLSMADTRRLFAESSTVPLQRSEHPRTATLAWERDESEEWQVVAKVQGEAIMIPCDPPLFVDVREGTIGPLAGHWSAQALGASASASGLTDGDVLSLRRRVSATDMAAGVPEFPAIQVIDGGVVRPDPSLVLSWRSDQGRPGSAEDFETGTAYALLFLDYPGREVHYGDDARISKVDGPVRTNYERDEKFERQCFDLISPKERILRKEKSGVVIVARGRYGDPKVAAAVRNYHAAVVPKAKESGFRVRLGPDWHASHVLVQNFDYTLTPTADGTFALQMEAEFDGAKVDMAALLVKLFTDKRVLAELLQPDPRLGTFLGPTIEGYRALIPNSFLAKLLPLISALVFNEKTGEFKLRRLDFAALETAQRDTDSRLTGCDSLLALGRELSEVPLKLPAKSASALAFPARIYQEYGSNWCDVRRRLGFGCLVGDEYAAGKTLQTLLTILAAYSEPEAKNCRMSLIVVTKTLFYDRRWQADAGQFLPSMSLLEIPFGAQLHLLERPGKAHAVIVSYDTLVRHVEVFGSRKWNVVACDEGHRLSRKTLATKAVRGLSARQKLIITGSGMENSPNELWTIMDIIVPGLLREKAWFNRAFPKYKMVDATPEEAASEPENVRARRARLVALGKIVAPFYLRRTNAELGRSLPKVNPVQRRVVLGAEQAKIYEGIRATQLKVVQDAIASGSPRARFHALTLINALRRLCDDPRLVKANGVPSAKLDSIVEVCGELKADGKKIVIASQWVGMLTLLQTALQEQDLSCVMIHGKVTGPARKRATDCFRLDDASVMLIQLGLAEGIELPEGDVIILCDPWWNAKKEEQAIARLRRDERSKHITLIRMVVAGSIEEAVIGLADRKLADIAALLEGHAAGDEVRIEDLEAFFAPLRQVLPEDEQHVQRPRLRLVT